MLISMHASYRDQAQSATFAVAVAEGLSEEADMRIDGRLTVAKHGRCTATVQDGGAAAGGRRTEARACLVQHEASLAPTSEHVDTCTFTAEDGQGSCSAFTRGLARATERQHGALIETSTAARALRLTHGPAGSRVTGVILASGAEISADAVVLCAGASVAPLAWTAGVYVPVQPLRGYSLTADVQAAPSPSPSLQPTCGLGKGARSLEEEARGLPSSVALRPTSEPLTTMNARPATEPTAVTSVRSHVVFQPSSLYVTRLGAQLRFTCFGEMTPVRSDGPGEPDPVLQAALHELVEAEVPNVAELCDWPNAVAWVGARPLTPDCYPLSGPTRVAGLYVNAGHSFNGWREATLSACVLADRLVLGSSGEGTASGAHVGSALLEPSVDGGAHQRGASEAAMRAYDPARFALRL